MVPHAQNQVSSSKVAAFLSFLIRLVRRLVARRIGLLESVCLFSDVNVEGLVKLCFPMSPRLLSMSNFIRYLHPKKVIYNRMSGMNGYQCEV